MNAADEFRTVIYNIGMTAPDTIVGDGVAEGRYPAPVKLSKRCVAWRSADIRALIASF